MNSNPMILLLVFVVLALLAIYLVRRQKPLSPAQRWALAASGEHIAFAARRLQSSYGSWHEMSDNYLAGRIWWGGDQDSNEHFRQAANRMLTEWSSPWVKLDWRTPLA